ncbi:hypothetical protein FISHEDRAFT_18954, partial [Fistulina hepatica ATCC 64428]
VLLLGAAALARAQSSAAASYSYETEGVIATGTMGVTNPAEATLGTAINQTSYSRLITANNVDDFCLFAPPDPNTTISDSETIEVSWCSQARNDARVIPDGTLTGVQFLKTEMYVQVMGYGDFTNLNIAPGDYGGELDPHGATGKGNPIGGNVTNNRTGSDLHYEEWMLYIDYDMFCLRICTNANSTYAAEYMCWHELDLMGCYFVMPGNYDFNGTFESCDADVAYPPGWYPTATVDGTTEFSTFAQYYTGVYTDNGTPVSYTVGTTVTPSAAYFTPSSSNCVTTSTVSNGIALAELGITTGSAASASASGSSKATSTKSGSSSTSTSSSASSSSSSSSAIASSG